MIQFSLPEDYFEAFCDIRARRLDLEFDRGELFVVVFQLHRDPMTVMVRWGVRYGCVTLQRDHRSFVVACKDDGDRATLESILRRIDYLYWANRVHGMRRKTRCVVGG